MTGKENLLSCSVLMYNNNEILPNAICRSLNNYHNIAYNVTMKIYKAF